MKRMLDETRKSSSKASRLTEGYQAIQSVFECALIYSKSHLKIERRNGREREVAHEERIRDAIIHSTVAILAGAWDSKRILDAGDAQRRLGVGK